jgi:hypothetical protein
LWLRELLGWTRTSFGRGVFATADVARIAVKASAVIRVFMTMLLGKSPGRFEGKQNLAPAHGILYSPFMPSCVKYFTEGVQNLTILSG